MRNTIRGMTVGALVLAGISALVLLPLFLIMGPEKVLVGSTLEFNTLWTGVALVVSLFAATMAGWVAHRVSGTMAAVAVLAVVVLLFGLVDASVHHWLMPHLSLNSAAVSGVVMLIGLREPLWYDLTGPVLMAIFVWVAGSSRHIEVAADQVTRQTRP